jgi:CDP-glucose 4,6-dehydratase
VDERRRAVAAMGVDPAFWAGRRVLVTGHSGFKGAWLSLWLRALGAQVTGLSAAAPGGASVYAAARVGDDVDEVAADVRDAAALARAVAEHRPEVVLHLAAQPLVRRSLAEPRATYEVNVMGTVNVLEAVRATPSVRALVVVTSDKAYANPVGREPRPFVEEDPMGGDDPYSSSKGCAELVVEAYRHSVLAADPDGPRVATARAGNVIGGGDDGEDRLIPDLVRGALAGAPIAVRNPEATRPWQHVLNPLSGYLRLAEALCADPAAQGGWNFGPALEDARPVRWIADRLTALWPAPLRWELDATEQPREAHFLALDSTKARTRLGWAPAWDLDSALRSIVAWYGALQAGEDLRVVTLAQIGAFQEAAAAGARS